MNIVTLVGDLIPAKLIQISRSLLGFLIHFGELDIFFAFEEKTGGDKLLFVPRYSEVIIHKQ